VPKSCPETPDGDAQVALYLDDASTSDTFPTSMIELMPQLIWIYGAIILNLSPINSDQNSQSQLEGRIIPRETNTELMPPLIRINGGIN
jgi:hypothetical protein